MTWVGYVSETSLTSLGLASNSLIHICIVAPGRGAARRRSEPCPPCAPRVLQPPDEGDNEEAERVLPPGGQLWPLQIVAGVFQFVLK